VLITPLRRMPARDPTHTYAGNFATTGLALREPPMIGFERASVTVSNSGNRPPIAAIAYPEPLMFEKSGVGVLSARPGGFFSGDGDHLSCTNQGNHGTNWPPSRSGAPASRGMAAWWRG
jgi:hypothetical protein